MKARILEPHEWQRLESGGELIKHCDPQNIQVVVVEKDGQIVASVCLLRITHFEGLWIKPEERGNPGIFRALIRKAYGIPRGRGETWAFGGAEYGDDKMGAICNRLGGNWLPVSFYALPVGEKDAS